MSGSSHYGDERLARGPSPKGQLSTHETRDPSPPPRSPHPLAPLPPSGGPKRGARGDPAIPFPPRRAGLRRRGPHSFLRIAATLRIAGRATRGMPRAPDPGAKTNLRGVAAHAARWGGTGRAPSNPPALGLGGRRGHTRRPRELAGAVGEVATPCTDGRPPENTPPWLGLHQSSLPNAAKGYPPREPRECIVSECSAR